MRGFENQSRVVSGIEDWSPPQKIRRRCALCPTLLRQSNPESLCSVCGPKWEREHPKKHAKPKY